MRRAVEDRLKNERNSFDLPIESHRRNVEDVEDVEEPPHRRIPEDPEETPLVIKKTMETHLFAGPSTTRHCGRCGRGRDVHYKKLSDIPHNNNSDPIT